METDNGKCGDPIQVEVRNKGLTPGGLPKKGVPFGETKIKPRKNREKLYFSLFFLRCNNVPWKFGTSFQSANLLRKWNETSKRLTTTARKTNDSI